MYAFNELKSVIDEIHVVSIRAVHHFQILEENFHTL